MKQGRPAEACPKFKESQRLDPSPGTLFNLSLCEEQLGHLATAWAGYRELVDTTPRSDPRVAPARKAIATLEPKLPRLKIAAPSNTSSTVELDGIELGPGSLGTYVPVDPGEHSVVLSSASGEVRKKVTLEVGQRLELDLAEPSPQSVPDASPRSAPSQVPATPKKDEQRPRHVERHAPPVAAYVVGGVGIASLVTGVVFWRVAVGKHDTVDDHCNGKACDPEGLDAAHTGSTYLRLADVATVVGAVGLATGAVLLWHDSRSRLQGNVVTGGATLSYQGVLE